MKTKTQQKRKCRQTSYESYKKYLSLTLAKATTLSKRTPNQQWTLNEKEEERKNTHQQQLFMLILRFQSNLIKVGFLYISVCMQCKQSTHSINVLTPCAYVCVTNTYIFNFSSLIERPNAHKHINSFLK